MATIKKPAAKAETAQPVALGVSRVKRWDDGRITFNLTVDRVKIYGCRIVEGRAGTFVSFPSRKGSNGKYYSHAYIKLTEDELQDICDKIAEKSN